MSSAALFQVLVDLLLISASVILWLKLTRPQKDDPRLSRGLQLLQSKIAVLEDLSDEMETQVQQLNLLLEAKAKDVQAQIAAADEMIVKIQSSMQKSLEVAEIFQDKIPHQEIIERQNTIKYVKAARMANQGLPAEKIAESLDLSRGEIDLIVKMNREQLQFSEEDLPEWAKGDTQKSNPELRKDLKNPSLDQLPLARMQDQIGLPQVDIQRKKQVSFEKPILEMPDSPILPKAEVLAKSATKMSAKTTSGKSVEVQKVVFPQINSTTI